MNDLKALAKNVRDVRHAWIEGKLDVSAIGTSTEALLAAVEAHECADTRAGPVVENSRLRSQVARLRTTLVALIEVASPAIGVARLGETKTFMEDTKRLRALKTLADKAMSAFDNARAALVDTADNEKWFIEHDAKTRADERESMDHEVHHLQQTLAAIHERLEGATSGAMWTRDWLGEAMTIMTMTREVAPERVASPTAEARIAALCAALDSALAGWTHDGCSDPGRFAGARAVLEHLATNGDRQAAHDAEDRMWRMACAALEGKTSYGEFDKALAAHDAKVKAESRRAALEEAAKVAEADAETQREWKPRVAAAIRALMERP